MQVQHFYNSLTNDWILPTHVLTLSATEVRIQVLAFTKIELTISALVGIRGYLLDRRGFVARNFEVGCQSYRTLDNTRVSIV